EPAVGAEREAVEALELRVRTTHDPRPGEPRAVPAAVAGDLVAGRHEEPVVVPREAEHDRGRAGDLLGRAVGHRHEACRRMTALCGTDAGEDRVAREGERRG